MSKWAVFNGDVQVTRAYSTKQAAECIAYAKGLNVRFAADFPGDRSGICLADGYTVRHIKEVLGDE